MGAPGAAFLPQIAALLEDPEPAMRRASARALGSLGRGAKQFVPKIVPLLKDLDSETRMHAVIALGNLGPENAPQIIPLLKDPDLLVQDEAAGALAEFARSGHPIHLRFCPISRDEDANNSVAMLLTEIGNQSPDVGDRLAFFASALEELEAGGGAEARADLRLWCGGDERLQRALDWLGFAKSLPDAAGLKAEELRRLLAFFSELWAVAEAEPLYPELPLPEWAQTKAKDGGAGLGFYKISPRERRQLMLNEIAERVGQMAAAAPQKADAELAALLRKLRAQCEAKEYVRAAIDRALERASTSAP